MRVTHLRADVRPEGGAVRLTFLRSSPDMAVRITRTLEQLDQEPRVVFEGLPERLAGIRFHHVADPAFDEECTGEYWDLEAYSELFDGDDNPLEGVTWRYEITPVSQGASPAAGGEGASVTATPQHARAAKLYLDIKPLMYQRLRYHAHRFVQGGVCEALWVGAQEHMLEGRPLPQVLIKTRKTLTERPVGLHQGQDEVQFRVTTEILLLCQSHGERDEVGDLLESALLCDLTLLEALGYDGLSMGSMDRTMPHPETVLYAREMTLDGTIDGGIVSLPQYRVRELGFPFKVALPRSGHSV